MSKTPRIQDLILQILNTKTISIEEATPIIKKASEYIAKNPELKPTSGLDKQTLALQPIDFCCPEKKFSVPALKIDICGYSLIMFLSGLTISFDPKNMTHTPCQPTEATPLPPKENELSHAPSEASSADVGFIGGAAHVNEHPKADDSAEG